MKKIVSGLLLTTLALTGVTPTTDASKRVDDLMARMTLDEKIGQLNQLTGWGDNDAMKGQIRAGQVGSLLNEVAPVVVHASGYPPRVRPRRHPRFQNHLPAAYRTGLDMEPRPRQTGFGHSSRRSLVYRRALDLLTHARHCA